MKEGLDKISEIVNYSKKYIYRFHLTQLSKSAKPLKTAIMIFRVIGIQAIACLTILFFQSCSQKLRIPEKINIEKNSVKVGVWIIIDDSTKMIEICKYKDGKLNGRYLKYHKNGNVAIKGKYVYGKKNGKWIYNYNNASGSTVIYRKDKVRKLIQFPPNF